MQVHARLAIHRKTKPCRHMRTAHLYRTLHATSLRTWTERVNLENHERFGGLRDGAHGIHVGRPETGTKIRLPHAFERPKQLGKSPEMAY